MQHGNKQAVIHKNVRVKSLQVTSLAYLRKDDLDFHP